MQSVVQTVPLHISRSILRESETSFESEYVLVMFSKGRIDTQVCRYFVQTPPLRSAGESRGPGPPVETWPFGLHGPGRDIQKDNQGGP